MASEWWAVVINALAVVVALAVPLFTRRRALTRAQEATSAIAIAAGIRALGGEHDAKLAEAVENAGRYASSEFARLTLRSGSTWLQLFFVTLYGSVLSTIAALAPWLFPSNTSGVFVVIGIAMAVIGVIIILVRATRYSRLKDAGVRPPTPVDEMRAMKEGFRLLAQGARSHGATRRQKRRQRAESRSPAP